MIKTIFSYDFRHTAINQIWKILSGPLLLLLIPIYLTPESQGYWYTFVNLAALVVFADLGFSTIILQFSAHEFANLTFSDKTTLIGNKKNLARLGSLLRFSLKWSTSMALGVFPFIIIIGYFILNEKESLVDWKTPWFIYAMASVFVFVNSIILSFIEGCNSVGNVQRIRFHISLINISTTLLLLIFNAQLYALAFSLLIGAASGMIIIMYRYGIMLNQLYQASNNIVNTWKKEIMPLMWRYAVSWISGYFIFSIFTPIAFHYYGVIEAGKVGFSIAVCTAIFGVANIWMIIIIPRINILVAHKNYKELDLLFKTHLNYSIITYLISIAVLFLLITIFDNILIAERLVSPISLLTITLGWFFQIIINSYAIYMRAHKIEPLFIVSLLAAVYTTITTLILSVYFKFDYFFIGFLSSYIIITPLVIFIFKKFKKSNSSLTIFKEKI